MTKKHVALSGYVWHLTRQETAMEFDKDFVHDQSLWSASHIDDWLECIKVWPDVWMDIETVAGIRCYLQLSDNDEEKHKAQTKLWKMT